jgi:site-specific DNA-methyltransferase (adenine-specific)
MAVEDICRLPVQSIAGKNSVLFLWATVPMMPEAFRVMAAWGYKYKTAIFWHKTGRLGLGYWFRGEVELLLFGTRGKVKAFRCQLPNFIETPALGHSEKPEEFRELIEAAISRTIETPQRVELFARRRVPGWDAWGDQVDSDIDMLRRPMQA